MKKKLLIICISVFLLFLAGGITFIKVGTSPVNKKNKDLVVFEFKQGTSRKEIIDKLYSKGLIKNKLAGYIYININRGKNLQANKYALNKSMSLKQILNKFDKGEIYDDRKTVTLKFVPGKRLTDYAGTIADFMNEYQDPANKVTKEDVISEISDPEYVKTLIEKYWFLTDEVLDSEIYYPLEGYLTPDTYEFYTTASAKDIVERMLQATDKRLKPLESNIKNSGFTTHQILSMAAIIEKEANSDDDRAKVSQVIRKRLELKMNLGMDVTAYYAAKVDQTIDNPYMRAWDYLPSKYNTRNANNIGLPVGPICNPSISSIKAALNPSKTNYVYFYADIKTGKVDFAETYAGFMDIQKRN